MKVGAVVPAGLLLVGLKLGIGLVLAPAGLAYCDGWPKMGA